VIDYLVKPISFERFLQAANKAYRLIRKSIENENTANQPEAKDNFIFVKVDKQLVKLNFSDILFVQGMQNYVYIHKKDEKLMVLVTLKKIYEMLPTSNFIQTHKSYIVSIKNVEAIMGNMVMINSETIPISRNFKENVMNKLVRDNLLKK